MYDISNIAVPILLFLSVQCDMFFYTNTYSIYITINLSFFYMIFNTLRRTVKLSPAWNVENYVQNWKCIVIYYDTWQILNLQALNNAVQNGKVLSEYNLCKICV